MKRAALPLKAAGLACATLLACHTGIGGHLSEGDKDRIREAVREGTRVLLPPVSDVDAYVSLYYAEDARLLAPNRPAVEGRQAIAALLRSWGAIREYKPTILGLDGRNDLACAHGAYEISMAPAGAAEPLGDKGKYVEIWRKQRDGTWKVVLDIFNSDLPSPAPATPAAPTPTPAARD